MKLKIKKLNENTRIPKYHHEGDAGFDLHSTELRTMEFGEPYLFKTGLAMEIPEGHFGLIRERSSLGRRGIKALGGVIDHNYRGEIGVVLVNTSHNEFTVRPGDRIAQMIIIPFLKAEIEESDNLSDTTRGSGGFGSTGR